MNQSEPAESQPWTSWLYTIATFWAKLDVLSFSFRNTLSKHIVWYISLDIIYSDFHNLSVISLVHSALAVARVINVTSFCIVSLPPNEESKEKSGERYESWDLYFKYIIEVFLSLEEGCETRVKPWEGCVRQNVLGVDRA